MKSRFLVRGFFLLMVFTFSACQSATPAPRPTDIPKVLPPPTPTSTPAPSPTPASLTLVFPLAAWQGVTIQTICLDMRELYSSELGTSTADAHRSKAATFLRELGFKTVSSPDPCDATLQIALSYMSNSASYTPTGGGSSFDCIVGISFDGSMLLSVPQHVPLYQDFHGEVNNAPTISINGCPDQSYSLEAEWSKGFLENLSSLMGPQVITFLYATPDQETRSAALAASEALGPHDLSLLPQVIQALKENPNAAGWLGSALQNMGPDAQMAALDTVPPLIDTLKSNMKNMPAGMDPSMAYQIDIETLGKFGPTAAQAAPLLLSILQDPNASSVRSPTIIALGNIGPGAANAVPELMKLVDDPVVGLDAAEALGKIAPADPQVLAFLTEKAKNRDTNSIGIAGLVKMNPSADTIQALAEVYENTDAGTSARGAAIDGLGTMAAASPAALQVVITAAGDHDPLVAGSAVTALGKLGPASPDILPVLKKDLSSRDDLLRSEAADALGNFGPAAQDSIPTLIAMVKSPQQVSLARLGALSALGKLGQASPEVLSALIGALKIAPDEASQALEKLGPPARSAVPGLIAALHEENANPEMYEYQLPMVRALVAITGEYHGFKSEDWQTWWDAQPKP